MKQNCYISQQEQAGEEKKKIPHKQMWAMIADQGHQKDVCTMVTINFHFQIEQKQIDIIQQFPPH